jgi:hypothetical protein
MPRDWRKTHGLLDWTWTAKRLHDRVRGTSPWPGAYVERAEGPLKILESRACPETAPDAVPGTIVAHENDGPRIACGAGSLVLTRLQRAGRKAVAGADFLRGCTGLPGRGAPVSRPRAVRATSPSTPCGPSTRGRRFCNRPWSRRAQKAGLDPRDRGLALELTSGVLRVSSGASTIASRPCCGAGLEADRARLLSVLRLAAYQLGFMDRVPARAAVHEAVAQARHGLR